jgi:ABC-2 type transport system ATP-binding protein
VLHGGKIVLEGTLPQLKARHKVDGLRIEFVSTEDCARFCEKAPEELLRHKECAGCDLTLHVPNLPVAQKIVLRILLENDILPSHIELLEPSIENLFLEAIR